jgi:hypothetical protein
VIITAAVWRAFAAWMQIDSCAFTVARDADDASGCGTRHWSRQPCPDKKAVALRHTTTRRVL